MARTLRRSMLLGASAFAIGVPALLVSPPSALAPRHPPSRNVKVTATASNLPVGFLGNTFKRRARHLRRDEQRELPLRIAERGHPGGCDGPQRRHQRLSVRRGIKSLVSPSANSRISVGSNFDRFWAGALSPAPAPPPQAQSNSYTNVTGVPEDVESAIWTVSRNFSMTPQADQPPDGSAPATQVVDYVRNLFLTRGHGGPIPAGAPRWVRRRAEVRTDRNVLRRPRPDQAERNHHPGHEAAGATVSYSMSARRTRPRIPPPP